MKSYKFKALLLCLALCIHSVGFAFDNKGQIPHSEVDQMLIAFQKISVSRDILHPEKIAGFLKKYKFTCDNHAFNPQGQLSTKPLECTVYDEDDTLPSPWPALILGISKQRVVAASMNSNSALNLKAPWHCDSTLGRAIICLYESANKKQKKYWFKRWDMSFKAAN